MKLHSQRYSIIATPGRLLHLIVEMNLDMRSVQYVVFDEADQLFEHGFSTATNTVFLHQGKRFYFPQHSPKLLLNSRKLDFRIQNWFASMQKAKLVVTCEWLFSP